MIKYSKNKWHKMWEHPDTDRVVEVSCGEGIMTHGFFRNNKWHNSNGKPNAHFNRFIAWNDI